MKKILFAIICGLLIINSMSSSIIIRNPGCNAYDDQGVCKSCSPRFYRDSNNICQPVNPNCKTYNQTTGDCLSCYSGFGLIEGTCLPGIQDQVSLDPNCNQFNDTVCVKCSYGYYFDKDGKCAKADPSCLTFDQTNGDCLSCYPGYALSSGKCNKQTTKAIDPNCNQFDSNNVCTKCSSGYFFSSGVCTKIDDSCKTFDTTKNVCAACYPGYVLNSQSKCVQQQPKQNTNPLCAEWNSTICTKCSKGSAFDQTGLCVLQDPYCKSYNTTTGICKKCYAGYALQNGACTLEAVKNVSDPNCYSFGSNGACSKCSTGYYFNDAKVCVKIDDSCKTFSVTNKRCMECYSGYQLSSSGNCDKLVQSVTDVNCAQWNGTLCVKCSVGATFNSNGLCVILDPQCKEYDQTTKLCKSCYDGYQLKSDSTTCVQSTASQVSDPNCAQWQGKVCVKCSFGAAFNNLGKCIILDSQCKSYDQFTGLCKECYSGYQLNNLQICIQSSPAQVSDPLCAQWSNQVCVRCSPGTFFGSSGKCTQIDTSCKAANSVTGQCLECYDGYKLSSDGSCVKYVQQVSDPNCASWNGKVCLKCSVGAAFDNFGKCVFLDPQCKQYDQTTGVCKACYIGYSLDSSSTCVKSAAQDVKDPLCAAWNGDVCTKCASNSYFNSQGVCTQVDTSCKQFDTASGQCLSCYPGYTLSIDKVCIKTAVQDNGNPLCAEWDSTGSLCLSCSAGSFFNGLGVCQAVDPLCKTSNALNGACTSCFDGYEVTSSGKCVKSQQQQRDPLCAEFSGQICTKCSFGAYFNSQGVCQLSDSLCSAFDQTSGACTKCYPGHILVSGKCQVDTTNTVNDPFCAEFTNGTCTKCSNGYYFEKDGKCTAADPLCASFNQLNGQCLSCFTGYQLKSGLCIQKEEDARDPNCAVFNSDNTCKTCSKGFIYNQVVKSCQSTNPLCKTIDQNGACTSCYSGYIVSNTTCVLDQNAESSFCAQMVDNICIRCASRTFLNLNGSCEKVSEDCRTYNDMNGQCLSCYSGFALGSGKCVKDSVKGGCSQLDPNGKCTKCASGFYLNNGQCSQVDAQCAKFNYNTANCEGCYSGYTLLQGRCQISTVNDQYEVKNCVAYNSENKCIQCFDRFYLTNNQCKDVSVFCKTYDLITGSCTGCYTNFKLKNGQCSK